MSQLSNFHAVHYRGIGGLQLDDIRAVNLITGPNGVGKTSLLEAIWLFNGRFTFAIPWNSHVQRTSQAVADPVSGLSGDGIEMSGTEQGVNRSWKVTIEPTVLTDASGFGSTPRGGNGSPQAEGLRAGGVQSPIPPASRLRVWLDGEDAGESTESVTSRDGVVVPLVASPPGRPVAIIHLPLALLDIETEVINRYSALVRRGAKDDLKDRLQLVLPRLMDVEVITNAGGQPFILATTADRRRLPLQALGGGMQRLFRLFVGFGECEHGIVLVDEIENGLHHGVLPNLWRQLRAMAREFDVQLFATTHSQECLAAALDAFEEDTEEIAVHGLYRKKDNGSVRAATYAGETLQGARDLNLELR